MIGLSIYRRMLLKNQKNCQKKPSPLFSAITSSVVILSGYPIPAVGDVG